MITIVGVQLNLTSDWSMDYNCLVIYSSSFFATDKSDIYRTLIVLHLEIQKISFAHAKSFDFFRFQDETLDINERFFTIM